jgi:mRNA interferase MazF
MVKKAYIPDRKDIVWIDLNPTRGHEQANVRPALVLSPKAYNQKTGLMLICAITSHQKQYPYEVVISSKKISGVVLSDQVRSVDWKERNAKYIQKVDQLVIEEVEEKLRTLIF